MARFRSLKSGVVLSQLLWRREVVLNLARDQQLQVTAITRRPVNWLLSLSLSSVSNPGKNGESEGGRLGAPKTNLPDNLTFFDSSSQEIPEGGYGELEEETSKDGNWRIQLEWLSDIIDGGTSKRSLPPGELAEKWDGSGTGRSLVDIVTGLLKSSAGMQQWGLADITLGLYLLSLRHTTEMAVDAVRGKQITSDFVVLEWLYLLELAWGAYMKDMAMLARVSLLQEDKIVKFVGKASVMRPAYYIGVDPRHKLVILSIRGTQTIQDIITDLSSDSEQPDQFDGEPVHFGSVEGARWFLRFEVGTLRRSLVANEGFDLLVIGHSLGGATAALLGMMLRQDSQKLLGLCPEQIKVVGIGTPPCVSKALAARCREYTSTLVLQDDVVPRVSSSALITLRNEILGTDWNHVLKEGGERKGLVDLVAGTIQALTSVQDAARKYGALARRTINLNGTAADDITATKGLADGDLEKQKQELMHTVKPPKKLPELVAPGTLFHICSRTIKTPDFSRNLEGNRSSLWKGDADYYLGRIILSSNMLSDHRCESYYYGLRDVLKGLPNSRKFTML